VPAIVQKRRIRSPRRKALTHFPPPLAELNAALRAHGNELKAELEDVVSDWSDENRPKFKVEAKTTDRELRVEVRPYKRRRASQIFAWVDAGTRPHVIKPKRKNKRGRLAFRTEYQPKTAPVARAHVGPGRATGPWVMPKMVRHPGTKARRFSETIQKRTYKRFRRTIENTFRRLARKQT